MKLSIRGREGVFHSEYRNHSCVDKMYLRYSHNSRENAQLPRLMASSRIEGCECGVRAGISD